MTRSVSSQSRTIINCAAAHASDGPLRHFRYQIQNTFIVCHLLSESPSRGSQTNRLQVMHGWECRQHRRRSPRWFPREHGGYWACAVRLCHGRLRHHSEGSEEDVHARVVMSIIKRLCYLTVLIELCIGSITEDWRDADDEPSLVAWHRSWSEGFYSKTKL